jgi:hypothetical protein
MDSLQITPESVFQRLNTYTSEINIIIAGNDYQTAENMLNQLSELVYDMIEIQLLSPVRNFKGVGNQIGKLRIRLENFIRTI